MKTGNLLTPTYNSHPPDSSMAVDKKNGGIYFPNLDGLRFLSFLMVFLHHTVVYDFSLLIIKGTFLERLLSTIGYGGSGVSIFFVLSGFLITYLLLQEKEANGKINIPFFYVRRGLRIWPLYYVVIIFSVIIYPLLKFALGNQLGLAITPSYYYTFLSNFDVINIKGNTDTGGQLMSTVTWSISIEEQFYLVWPLLFSLIPRKFYSYIFAVIIFLSLCFRFLHGNDSIILYFHTFSVAMDLAIGGLAAYMFFYDAGKLKLFFGQLNKKLIVAVYLIGFGWLLYGDHHLEGHSSYPFAHLLSVLFFAFIILEQNFASHSFYKFSNNRLFSFWGKYTYGLYMLHSIVLYVLNIIIWKVLKFQNPTGLSASLLRVAIGLPLSCCVAYFCYEYFEKRFLKLKEGFYGNNNFLKRIFYRPIRPKEVLLQKN